MRSWCAAGRSFATCERRGPARATSVWCWHAERPRGHRRGQPHRPGGDPADPRARPDVEVVASCGDLPELMEAIERESPDVVLTDIRMPPGQGDEGIRVAGWLRESHPEIGVVVLSQYAEPSYALTLLEPGSDRPRLPAQGAGARRLASCVAAIEAVAAGRRDHRPEARRRAGLGKAAARALAAGRADAARTRGARRDRAGQEQRGDRRLARAHQARRREAHQLDLPQARPRVPDDVSRRVKAALLFLSETDLPPA